MGLFEGLYNWLEDWWLELTDWFETLFTDLTEFLIDLPVTLIKEILDAIATLIESIALPSFLTNGISTLYGALSPDVIYYLTLSGFPEGLAIFGSGVAFRLLRKLFTLGQW